MEAIIYHKSLDGWYICGCGFESTENDLTHVSSLLSCYCNNGIKAILDNKYKCICGKILDNPIIGKRHCHSGICVKNAKELELFTCRLCDVECHTAYELMRHEKTKRHNDKLNQPLTCKICNITCSSQNQIKAHFETPKHKERELTKQIQLDLECAICKIKCRGQKEMQTHLQTKKHLKLSLVSI